MPGYKIQGNYDDLVQAADTFSREADQTQQFLQQVNQLLDAVRNGGWIGLGSESFQNEMSDLVVPGMDRLYRALEDASNATKRVADIFRQAEDEAGGLFR